jgi:lipopolysaccharide/colanic/teichoic acid biosynthesis glycosyltransferase
MTNRFVFAAFACFAPDTPVIKRIFDVLVSSLALLVCASLFLLIAIAIKLDSKGPVFFSQQRMGKHFRPFWIYKFRTMVEDASSRGGQISTQNDPRITGVGGFLRKTKLDELPQLINVLRGEMSLVGPRPEVPTYVELFRNDYEEILRVHPGITDLASLKYRAEAALLARSSNPEQEYVEHVLPDKIKLAKEYVSKSSFLFDLALILRTPLRLFS